MGALPGLMGLGGGQSGTGITPINPNLNTSQVQGAMQNQSALLNAIQAQNGLQNQSNVYNQYQGIVSGNGPNPAQAMLNQQTGQNAAQTGALLAGQRGASYNPALAGRNAAMTGANAQQQAVGQGATMQANQSLNALGQAGGLANTMAANQIGQTNAVEQAQQGLLNTQAGMQQNANNIYGNLANTQLQGQQGLIGGLMNAAGPVINSAAGLVPIAAAQGGVIQNMADGGSAFSGPQSEFGQYLASSTPVQPTNFSGNNPGAAELAGADKQSNVKWQKSPSPLIDTNQFGQTMAAEGGKVPALLSPGEKYLAPGEAKAVAEGKASPDKVGKKVPGKPKYPGNNYANDTVPAKLDVGGIVIPNSIMQSDNPMKGTIAFVHAHLKSRKAAKK